MLVVLTPTSWPTAEGQARMFGAAGWWTYCWRRSDAMTEQEWLACQNTQSMLEYLVGRCSHRKFRLFGCACCRRIWQLLVDDRTRHHAHHYLGFSETQWRLFQK